MSKNNEIENRRVSTFHNYPIKDDLLSVPGINQSGINKLRRRCDIYTTNQLVGKFWMLDRNQIRFIEFLTENVGIKYKFAKECTENMTKKFRSM